MKKRLAAIAALMCSVLSGPVYAAGNPATGDDRASPIWLYILIVAAAVVIAAALILPYLKKDKKGKTDIRPGEEPPKPKD